MRVRSVVFLITLSLALPVFAASSQPAKGTVAVIALGGLQKEAVLSYSFGVTNVTSSTGSGGGAGKPAFSEFNFTKKFDSQSPAIFINCASGTSLGNVTLELLDDRGNTVATIKLSEAVVSSYSTGFSSGGDFVDSISLKFDRIEFLKVLIGL